MARKEQEPKDKKSFWDKLVIYALPILASILSVFTYFDSVSKEKYEKEYAKLEYELNSKIRVDNENDRMRRFVSENFKLLFSEDTSVVRKMKKVFDTFDTKESGAIMNTILEIRKKDHSTSRSVIKILEEPRKPESGKSAISTGSIKPVNAADEQFVTVTVLRNGVPVSNTNVVFDLNEKPYSGITGENGTTTVKVASFDKSKWYSFTVNGIDYLRKIYYNGVTINIE